MPTPGGVRRRRRLFRGAKCDGEPDGTGGNAHGNLDRNRNRERHPNRVIDGHIHAYHDPRDRGRADSVSDSIVD